eukprot:TRINITY_DN50757_c0_g1_i1.p1 TRINITY_DN50757_c0_g1~~TRINITY_DN50757_c0_g1_i1.p1  ORF type:complete len:305 (+),score=138.81 TRINITY_DN50757_c0_g1_i1:52-915(+)
MADKIHKGWFSELSPMWPGQALSLEMEGEPLWDKKSDFQDVLVFKNKGPWGTVFALDGAIQVTDKDEFSYHEMMAHLPCFSHPNPKNVLIIGGGDGGVMREVLKHPSVETVTLCDVDKMVPEISKKFFPHLSCSFDDPRATVHIGDGFAFLDDKEGQYDVMIVDSSDPEGPASTLFGKEFYARCRKSLRPGGVLVTQGESYWIHLELIKSMTGFIRDIGFKHVEYAAITQPTYPCGGIGFFVCSDERSSTTPARNPTPEMQETLKMYSPEMHVQSFVLPPFVKRALA